MPLAIVGIGIPGSGKSTFLKQLAQERGCTYINKDEIREELLGDINDQSKNREVWMESNRRTEDALRSGVPVVLDSTYIERWKRKELVTFLRQSGANRVIALHFNTPYEESVQRNRLRERAVPDQTMEWMRKQELKEPPDESEGFDRVYTLSDLETFLKELP